MPTEYFQTIPVTNYDVDGDGTSKVVVDILRRVKLRAAALVDGAVFYNYQMQDGDTAEIISEKYYGSSKYHWVVMLMNNFLHHTYDMALTDGNFSSYINDTYGSFARALGTKKYPAGHALDTVSADSPAGTSNIATEWFSTEVSAQKNSSQEPNYSVLMGSSVELYSGTVPAGHSTGIFKRGRRGAENPWGTTISVGDTVTIFVRPEWYQLRDYTVSPSLQMANSVFLPYATSAEIVYISERADPTATETHSYFTLHTNLNSNSYPTFSDSSGDYSVPTWYIETGIHHFEMDLTNNAGTKLANNIVIDQAQYVNTTFGTSGDKRIVYNYQYEEDKNEDKRVIYLLRKEYLYEFIDEFEKLVNIG